MTSGSSSQWANLLHNLGAWQGSFTRLSPQGEIQQDIPTLVTFEGVNDNQTIRQTVQHFSLDGEVVTEKVLVYSSLNRGVLFFEDGAFSQGSIQFGPFSEFGAELGFINGNRRLRLVQLFDKDSNLSRLTLIRERLLNTQAPVFNTQPPVFNTQPPVFNTQPVLPVNLKAWGRWGTRLTDTPLACIAASTVAIELRRGLIRRSIAGD